MSSYLRVLQRLSGDDSEAVRPEVEQARPAEEPAPQTDHWADWTSKSPRVNRLSGTRSDSHLRRLTQQQEASLAHPLLQLPQHEQPKVILLTSSKRGEGTSTIARRMALALSRTPKRRVLLVDTDLRAPVQHLYVGADRHDGLADAVVPGEDSRVTIHVSDDGGYSLLSSGRELDNLSTAFDPEAMARLLDQLQLDYDFLILDAPPVTEAPETLLLAGLADACVLVVAAGKTRSGAVERARDLLQGTRTPLLGGILNRRREHLPSALARWLATG